MLKMKKFRVTATLDVGYQAIVEAKDEEHAWAIAREDVAGEIADWEKIDDGHDWTLEDVWEVEETGQ
tara:strand:+ start:502 stop:702 length:201 start_codon:yes stop_codon:yes gene_type:complete